ncbi:hypothetical protein VT91_19020 [Clostridium sporogenes]|uniref:hypothetical protein n=1 Tax=Clostridium botulinum TaxID=1491 RepID=UPI000717B717|nr:hypothetical protein [Clostridium botulinum]KRU25658.1 hypothetical protein VT28_32720 [Clostridium sporogenes]KRU27410.1 hypothetical protein WG71_22590 [Clostridium sporogenes]KRU30332.1 hypothetical protein VT91_19020 [Clostridium sporogenes]KRU38516.1 hypothetical protein VT95_32900 [Clostridium sporogenes]MBZ1329051.1 hypothetical protein [Clostridium botulinum]
MNELYKKEYITTSNINTKTNIKLNFGDKESIRSEDDLIITDFDDVVYQYLIWIGEKLKKCEVCGKWIKLKGTSPKKYCNICSKEVIKEKDRFRKTLKNNDF